MRCLAVCQDELVIRMLDEILLPGFDVEFIVESRTVARRLHDAHVTATAGDPEEGLTYQTLAKALQMSSRAREAVRGFG